MCNSNKIFCITVIFNVCVVFSTSGRVKRLVGGLEVDCGTELRMTSLRNSTSLQHLCGAYIVTKDFALTAAHCVQKPVQHYLLQLNNYCEVEKPKAEVLAIHVHEFYDKYSSAHDIAILRISLELDDDTWLLDDVLPSSSFGLTGECTIYGYGSTSRQDPNETSDSLKSAKVVIVSLDHCTNVLGPIAPLHDSGMMCALGDHSDTCQGDSGGPLICNSLVEGISSHGLSCGIPGVPGVYTSIGAHLRWIRMITTDSAARLISKQVDRKTD